MSDRLDGIFFEDVLFALDDATASRFRNLLGVNFTIAEDKVRVEYRLHSSMTTQLLFLERMGGIDVDSG